MVWLLLQVDVTRGYHKRHGVAGEWEYLLRRDQLPPHVGAMWAAGSRGVKFAFEMGTDGRGILTVTPTGCTAAARHSDADVESGQQEGEVVSKKLDCRFLMGLG
jgi:hypothetical protein